MNGWMKLFLPEMLRLSDGFDLKNQIIIDLTQCNGANKIDVNVCNRNCFKSGVRSNQAALIFHIAQKTAQIQEVFIYSICRVSFYCLMVREKLSQYSGYALV